MDTGGGIISRGQDTPVMLLDHSIIENGLVESLGE